jgi:hypothetical protein
MNDKTKPITVGSDISDKAKPAVGSNISDKTKPVDLWDRTKAWVDQNRTIAGALVGGAAGTIMPGLGTVIGAILGAGIGFASSKEKKEER